MSTIYALFTCALLYGGQTACEPLSGREWTFESAAACEAQKARMPPNDEAKFLAHAAGKLVCMQKTAPAWEPAR